MDFRIGYRRPLRTVSLLRKKRQRVRLGIAAGVAVAAVVVAMQWDRAPAQIKPLAAAAPVVSLALSSVAPATAGAVRPVYPYSIIPGGVATRDDLAQRVKTDDVVARHYASFDIKNARPTTVAKARAVHVSYRKGDKVYWTARTVMLAAGETVLTDGHSEIRGRCGNRISDQAQLPVAMQEPSEQELDASMNVAMDADDAGSTQFASFDPDGASSGSPTQYMHLASFTQPDATAPASIMNASMPAMPAFSTGNGGLGIQPTRYLTVSASPTVALGPSTEAATTVTPATASDTSSAASIPGASVTVATAPDNVVAVQPLGSPDGSGTMTVASLATAGQVAAVPVTPAASVTPVTAATPHVLIKAAVPEGDIPEPGTLWLSGLAFAAMLATGRRRAAKPQR